MTQGNGAEPSRTARPRGNGALNKRQPRSDFLVKKRCFFGVFGL